MLLLHGQHGNIKDQEKKAIFKGAENPGGRKKTQIEQENNLEQKEG